MSKPKPEPPVRICAHADDGGPAHLLRAGEKCDRVRCPKCGGPAVPSKTTARTWACSSCGSVFRPLAPGQEGHCRACGASASEIRKHGHRRFDVDGRAWPRTADKPNTRACPEACTCYPEHVSWAEHQRECQR